MGLSFHDEGTMLDSPAGMRFDPGYADSTSGVGRLAYQEPENGWGIVDSQGSDCIKETKRWPFFDSGSEPWKLVLSMSVMSSRWSPSLSRSTYDHEPYVLRRGPHSPWCVFFTESPSNAGWKPDGFKWSLGDNLLPGGAAEGSMFGKGRRYG